MTNHHYTFAVLALASLLAGCNSRVSREPAPNLMLAKAIREKVEAGASVEGPEKVAADPQGWATLKGTFKISGTPEPRSVLPVTKDEAVCKPGGQEVLDNYLVVGPNNELANVLIFLATKTPDETKWIHESYAATKTAQFEYDQKACVFLSHVFAMRSTQSLKILNSDPVSHNANLSTKGNANPFNSNIPPGGSVVYTPGGDEPSAFPVACGVHPWMKAWMIVRDNPYFAVTKADGSFEIANLPAGVELEFRVWHELSQGVEKVTVNGESQPWPKGKYKVKLADGVPQEINVVVEASAFK